MGHWTHLLKRSDGGRTTDRNHVAGAFATVTNRRPRDQLQTGATETGYKPAPQRPTDGSYDPSYPCFLRAHARLKPAERSMPFFCDLSLW